MVAQWEMDLYWQDEFNKICLKFCSQWVNIKGMTQKQKFLEDWGNGLVVNNTYDSFRGSSTSDPIPLPVLAGTSQTWRTDIHARNTPTHKINK